MVSSYLRLHVKPSLALVAEEDEYAERLPDLGDSLQRPGLKCGMKGTLGVTLTLMTLLRVILTVMTVTLIVTLTVMRTSGQWQDVSSRRINRNGHHKDNTGATQHMVTGTTTSNEADKLFKGLGEMFIQICKCILEAPDLWEGPLPDVHPAVDVTCVLSLLHRQHPHGERLEAEAGAKIHPSSHRGRNI